MWAAFKSDLKEFASGAANETNAVASKVVGVPILKEGSGVASAAADADAANNGGVQRHEGSVLLANAAYSIGTKSLQGLSSVTSLVGGIVAPRASSNYNHDEYNNNNNNNNNNRGGTSYSGGSALSSMLVKDDDDEEEMGWDDDDEDDDELNFKEDGDDDDDDDASVVIEGKECTKKQANPASDSNTVNAPPPPSSQHSDKSSSPSVDEEVLRALQTKLELVEKCRADLQSEHRRQTAELVELRAKLVEMEQQQHHQSSSSEGESVLLMDESTGTNEDSVQALQHEIERLKQIFEEQLKDASEEHKQAVAVLIQEKESLEKELYSQRQKNQDLVTEMQTLMETNNQRESLPAEPSIDEQALLHQYQTQIQELTLELEALQANLDDTTTALNQVNDHNTMQRQRHQEEMKQQLARTSALEETLLETKEDRARAIEEVEESKVKLVEMEKVVQDVRTELETKELEFEDRLQVEIARVKTSQSESILNTTTASSYVTSDDGPRHDEEEYEEDIINDHVNLAAAVTNMADVGDNIIAKGSNDEESRKVDAKKEQTPAGVVDFAKSDTEEELSDDWGDGGWGDDD